MRIVVRPAAAADIDEAFLWYERAARPLIYPVIRDTRSVLPRHWAGIECGGREFHSPC